jgi:hypothetical protein
MMLSLVVDGTETRPYSQITAAPDDRPQKGRAQLKTGLRRKQIAVAMTGSVAMLIWLGKQHLGQQEKIIETRRGMAQLFDDELPVHKFETAEEAREFLRRMGVHG